MKLTGYFWCRFRKSTSIFQAEQERGFYLKAESLINRRNSVIIYDVGTNSKRGGFEFLKNTFPEWIFQSVMGNSYVRSRPRLQKLRNQET